MSIRVEARQLAEQRRSYFYKPDEEQWEYIVYTGPRCYGVVSRRKYASMRGALKAGENFVNRLSNS